MSHETRSESGRLIVSLEGEVDLNESPKVRDLLLAAVRESAHVLVDLSRVSYMDSSGVATLVEAFQTSRGTGVGFALANVSDAVLRVLKLARLDTVFVIHESLEDGLADGG